MKSRNPNLDRFDESHPIIRRHERTPMKIRGTDFVMYAR
jgi:hypothetical protein